MDPFKDDWFCKDDWYTTDTIPRFSNSSDVVVAQWLLHYQAVSGSRIVTLTANRCVCAALNKFERIGFKVELQYIATGKEVLPLERSKVWVQISWSQKSESSRVVRP